MKYVKIDSERIVREVIPDYDQRFPGVPVTARYSQEFLNGCLEVSDGVKVSQDMEYLPLENAFAPQIFYTGVQNITLLDSETAFLPVSFSEGGSWAVVQSGDLETSRTDSGLNVTGGIPGAYELIVEFTDAAYGRQKRQSISVSVLNARTKNGENVVGGGGNS